MQALRRVLLGDNPIRAGVGQAEVDQPALVERGSSVMQPVIILGGAAVAQPAVAAGQPGDGAFDHGPMLAVFGQPVRVSGCLPGGAQLRVMGPTLSSADPRPPTGAANKSASWHETPPPLPAAHRLPSTADQT